MRKFSQPFDFYEVGPERLISVETNPQLGTYKHLVDNPIYYYHALQFRRGGFYRAIWGYENIWDSELEEKLNASLDCYLHQAIDDNKYYFETIRLEHPAKSYGLLWKRGLKPLKLSFTMTQSISMPKETELLCRINLLDTPHHVDCQFESEDGPVVFTIPYIDYYTRLKELSYAKRINASKARTHAKDGKRRETTEAKRFSGKNTTKEMAFELSRVRQKFRRSYSVR